MYFCLFKGEDIRIIFFFFFKVNLRPLAVMGYVACKCNIKVRKKAVDSDVRFSIIINFSFIKLLVKCFI